MSFLRRSRDAVRFIDLEDLDWSDPELIKALDNLEKANAEVLAETEPERRRQLIKRYRDRWVALRPFLAALSYNKCWYIECLNPGTDDDVDHFRPKLGVEEDPSHPGYY